jgi:hypothetical protein
VRTAVLHLPRDDAVLDAAGRAYCGDAHRLARARADAGGASRPATVIGPAKANAAAVTVAPVTAGSVTAARTTAARGIATTVGIR